jgi:two-component system phosphate regulon response regulator OmpR
MNVLIVDDDEKIRELLKLSLQNNGFNVWDAKSAIEARPILTHAPIDLMILDVMMPNENGFSFLKYLREHGYDLPVLFLSAKDGSSDKIEGFFQGADDYLAKPFDPDELIMRIRAILKRVPEKSSIQLGEITFLVKQERLESGSNRLDISSTQISLLKFLAERPYQALSREELAKKSNYTISERSVDVQITRLRKIIDKKYLKTIRHVGYMLCPSPMEKI